MGEWVSQNLGEANLIPPHSITKQRPGRVPPPLVWGVCQDKPVEWRGLLRSFLWIPPRLVKRNSPGAPLAQLTEGKEGGVRRQG